MSLCLAARADAVRSMVGDMIMVTFFALTHTTAPVIHHVNVMNLFHLTMNMDSQPSLGASMVNIYEHGNL